MNWVQEINELSIEYAPLVNALGVLWLPFSAIGAIIWCGFKVVKKYFFTTKKFVRNLSKEEREIFYQVYSKIVEATALVFRDGRIKDDAKRLYWEARDQSRLTLPDDIQEYTQKLFDKMHEAYILSSFKLQTTQNGGLPVGEERRNAAKQHSKLIMELMQDPPYEVFAQYMKVKIQ